VKNLPVRYRRWFLDRLVKEFKKMEEARENSQRPTSSERRSVIQDLPMGEMNPSARHVREKKFK